LEVQNWNACEGTRMKIYLAALFGRRPEMETVADKLKSHGFEIASSWVYGGEDGLTREDIAILDLKDVDASDAVMSFTQPYRSMSSGGGRHVEFGYGLAKGKRCILIGERENVFHHFPAIEVYATLEAFLEMAIA
jgi:nucleoside 2-deoxyribosyltransferase